MSDCRPEAPTSQAHCSCGEATRWIWDKELNEWWEKPCWRCNEIALMKADSIASRLGLSSNGHMSPELAERFAKLVGSKAVLLPTVEEFRHDWPFPWLRPWSWPAWIVWRWKRGRSSDRAMVEVPDWSKGGGK